MIHRGGIAAGGEPHFRIDLVGARDLPEPELAGQAGDGALMGREGVAMEEHDGQAEQIGLLLGADSRASPNPAVVTRAWG